MKKRFTLLLSIILILLCTSCSSSCSCLTNNYQTFPDGVYVTVPDALKVHMLYPEHVPSLFFDMKDVNVTENSSPSARIFVRNDYYKISEAWAKHLDRYEEDEYIIAQASEPMTKDGKFKNKLIRVRYLDEIIEDGTTFSENAYIKAKAIKERTSLPVLSDDSGLIIDALNGFPGINTARFSKEQGGYDNAMKELNLIHPNLDLDSLLVLYYEQTDDEIPDIGYNSELKYMFEFINRKLLQKEFDTFNIEQTF